MSDWLSSYITSSTIYLMFTFTEPCHIPLLCQNGGVMNLKDCSRCLCPEGFDGDLCENLSDSIGDGE